MVKQPLIVLTSSAVGKDLEVRPPSLLILISESFSDLVGTLSLVVNPKVKRAMIKERNVRLGKSVFDFKEEPAVRRNACVI